MSGLNRHPAKVLACEKQVRGFESHTYRHDKEMHMTSAHRTELFRIETSGMTPEEKNMSAVKYLILAHNGDTNARQMVSAMGWDYQS